MATKKNMLKIGDAEIEMCSYEDGKCLHFGKARCIHSNLKEEQKNLPKSKKCKGFDPKCSYFIGESPYCPDYDDKYLLPPLDSEMSTRALASGDNILAVGPPGAGKSSLFLQLAAIFNWGVERFSCSEETSSSKIIGQWVVVGDTMEWVDGYITHAMKEGLMLLEDEADFMRPELRGEVHSLMEKGGSINLVGVHPKTKKIYREVVKKHERFRWVSTANTVGYGDDAFAFHGTQFFNAASRDRYDIIIKMNYRLKDEEIAILNKKTGIDEDIAEKMVGIANECRKSTKDGMIYQFSLRRLLSWAKYHQIMPPEIAAEITVLNFANDSDSHTLKSLMRTNMNLDVDEFKRKLIEEDDE
jgi:nitric oxide reductase NorQ protein